MTIKGNLGHGTKLKSVMHWDFVGTCIHLQPLLTYSKTLPYVKNAKVKPVLRVIKGEYGN